MTRIKALRMVLLAMGISALSLCIVNVRVHAAYEAYLKIEGLDGGSKDPAHVGWVAVARVASGDLNSEAAADREASAPSVSELAVRKSGGGRRAAMAMPTGRRVHRPFVVVREIDAASPKLHEACATGKHFPSALVETGGKQYKLYDVVIASIQNSSGGDKPMETVTLNFSKIELVK